MKSVFIKKWLIPLLIGAVIYVLGKNQYNTFVEMQGTAQAQWANVESAYQRRADLIPNLVATVKGYADHEKETLEAVIKARSEATKVNIDASNLNAENIAQYQQAQQGLSGALSKLLLVVERYPDLKANNNFLELQSQLEGTENRINVERNRFNDKAGSYNIYIKKFPQFLLASIYGFDAMSLFKSSPGSENAPKVEF